MELSYENLKNNPKTLLAFTGFDMGEFQILLKAFTIAWEKYVQQHRLPLEIRQRGYGGGRKSQLSTNEINCFSSWYTSKRIHFRKCLHSIST